MARTWRSCVGSLSEFWKPLSRGAMRPPGRRQRVPLPALSPAYWRLDWGPGREASDDAM